MVKAMPSTSPQPRKGEFLPQPPTRESEHARAMFGAGWEAGRSSGEGQGLASAVATPITHLMAGTKLSIGKGIQKQFGVGEFSVDDFLSTHSDFAASMLAAWLDLGYLCEAQIDRFLTDYVTGSKGQAVAFSELNNIAIKQLGLASDELLKPFYVNPDLRVTESDWNAAFYPVEEDYLTMLDGESGPVLIATAAGVSVMDFDLTGLEPQVAQLIKQSLYFCGRLSSHGFTSDMYQDEYFQYLFIGECAEFIDPTEQPTDFESFKQEVISGLQDVHEYSEDDVTDFVDLESVYDSIQNVYKATADAKLLVEPTQDLVAKMLADLEGTADVPECVLTVLRCLTTHFDWQAFHASKASYAGEGIYDFARPISFDMEIDHDVLAAYHDNLMTADEVAYMSLPINEHSAKVLANLTICESLVRFLTVEVDKLRGSDD